MKKFVFWGLAVLALLLGSGIVGGESRCYEYCNEYGTCYGEADACYCENDWGHNVHHFKEAIEGGNIEFKDDNVVLLFPEEGACEEFPEEGNGVWYDFIGIYKPIVEVISPKAGEERNTSLFLEIEAKIKFGFIRIDGQLPIENLKIKADSITVKLTYEDETDVKGTLSINPNEDAEEIEISFTPKDSYRLPNGVYTVEVYGEDNRGQSTKKAWKFILRQKYMGGALELLHEVYYEASLNNKKGDPSALKEENWINYVNDPGKKMFNFSTYKIVGQQGDGVCSYDEKEKTYYCNFRNTGSYAVGRYSLPSKKYFTKAKLSLYMYTRQCEPLDVICGNHRISANDCKTATFNPFILEVYIDGIKAGEKSIEKSDVCCDECYVDIPLDIDTVKVGENVGIELRSNRLKKENPITDFNKYYLEAIEIYSYFSYYWGWMTSSAVEVYEPAEIVIDEQPKEEEFSGSFRTVDYFFGEERVISKFSSVCGSHDYGIYGKSKIEATLSKAKNKNDTYEWETIGTYICDKSNCNDCTHDLPNMYADGIKYDIKLTSDDPSGVFGISSGVLSAFRVIFGTPIVYMDTEPYEPRVDEEITFDGSNSYDPDDGEMVRYLWDFNDTNAAEGKIVTHKYNKSSIYHVRLTVFDNDGLNGSRLFNVWVRGHPYATFTYSPENVSEGDIISFDASNSSDDRKIVKYEWNFGDGNVSEGDKIIEHAYEGAGDYTVTLTVTDDEGLTDSFSDEIKVKKKLKLLIIPVNWQGDYASFKTKAEQIGDYYLERIPLKYCPEKFKPLISEQQNYGYGWAGWYCYDSGISFSPCNDRHTLQKIAICAAQYKKRTTKKYDYVVGITDRDICGTIAGWSDGRGGLPVVIAESIVPGVVTHELGHEFGLADEYCDCSGTPYASYCGPTAPINPLKAELGCDTSTCCWGYGNGPYDHVCGWCHGNYDRLWSQGIGLQRSTMSNKILSGETGYHDINEYAHLKTIPELKCDSSEVSTSSSLMSTTTNNNQHSVYSDSLLTVSLIVFNNDTVESSEVDVSFGYTPIIYPQEGDYSLRILDINNNPLYSRNMSLDFILFSDPPQIVNYSYVYDKIPFNKSMNKIELYHNENLIFSQEFNFCNENSSCDENENYYSCPSDCLPYEEDGICNKEKDSGCDIDCLVEIDPDCSLTLNAGWNLISIPFNISNKTAEWLCNQVNCSSIFAFPNQTWKYYDPAQSVNTLGNFDETMGLWIKINKSLELSLEGSSFEKAEIDLLGGWNLIGYHYLNEININNFDLKNNIIFTYINNSWSSHIPNRTFNSLKTLKPSYGYWVKK